MTYGPQSGFEFGWNIHDFDPDRQAGKRTPASDTERYERSADNVGEHDALVSEVLALIKATTQVVKERYSMIQPQGKQDSNPASSRTNASGGIPTLKVENVNFEKRIARIIAVREVQGKYGKQVAVKVAYAAATYLWYVSMNNPLLAKLCEMFSQDENKWPGEEFLLFLETDEFTNKNQMQVERVTATKKRG